MLSFFKNLSFQSKLLAIVLTTSLITLLLTGWISYTTSRNTLTEASYNQLTGLRNARAQAIADYFDTLQHQVLTSSESGIVISSIKEFKPAFQKLKETKLSPPQIQKLEHYYDQEFIPGLRKVMGGNPSLATYFPTNPASKYLKYYYTANNPYPKEREKLDNPKDGSDYSKIHEEYHARFRRLAKVFDYYDIFLVDIDTGHVLYTVKKEVDFGADLISGPFSDTGLAKAFQAVRKSRDPLFVTAIDFEKYKPSYGNPAAFVATTVFDGDKFIGALIIQLPPDRIDKIMNAHNEWEKVGLGKTGEALLIGPDRVLRSTPRFFIEEPEKYLKTIAQQGVSPETIALIKSSGSPMLDQKINTPAAENALAGKTGTAPLIDYRGVPVLSSYQPIKLGDFEWGLIAKMDQAEIFKGVNDLARRLLVMAAILIPLIAFFSSWIARKFLTPIRRLIAATHQVEAGNTEVEVKVDSTDEFGQLSQSFNQMAKTLTEKEQTIQSQIGENNRLLLNILPPKAAERLKSGEQEVVDSFANVTVLFADIEGFNTLAAEISPEKAIFLLNDLIGAFDAAAEHYGIERLENGGSQYLGVCGLSVPRVDHAKRTIDFALEMLSIIRRFSQQHEVDLSLDIGVHSGSISAGIVGKAKFNYALWGDTINITRAIHRSPDQNVIQATKSIVDSLQGLYHFEPLQDVVIKKGKGNGKVQVWAVTPLASSGLTLEKVEV